MDRYLVFARSAYAEPLGYLGELEVPAGQEPQRLALQAHGAAWVELVLIPQPAITWAIAEQAAAAEPQEAQP